MNKFTLRNGVYAFTFPAINPSVSYRPTAYHSLKIGREGSSAHVRQELLQLTGEHEQLRAWVRSLGMLPPRFSAPADWGEDVAQNPVTEFQRELVGGE